MWLKKGNQVRMGMTREQGIQKVVGGGGHIVILGAGASIASTMRNPEQNGKQLPSMANFISVVGLQDIVDTVPQELRSDDFEKLYSNLYTDNQESAAIKEIEKRVYEYFQDMRLPDIPTIYDYLVMSLRPKDIIATFNWDPFLFQAWNRNHNKGENPHLAFLHGNVAIGYSIDNKKSGPAGMYAKGGGYFEPTKLLYPVTQKNYNQDEFIKKEWDRVRYWLSRESGAVRVTIFGYGAPTTDAEAVALLSEAWGKASKRTMEQFEMIDIRAEDELTDLWKNFIFSHHYDYFSDYFDSELAYFPRRTSESYYHQFCPSTEDEALQEPNPVPLNFQTLEEMWEWFEPLINAEAAWRIENG